jgi:hypothetical protein
MIPYSSNEIRVFIMVMLTNILWIIIYELHNFLKKSYFFKKWNIFLMAMLAYTIYASYGFFSSSLSYDLLTSYSYSYSQLLEFNKI